ncbi:MAG: ArnT family glycosyltransferase [Alphaproteobacteria bacterium]
MNKYLQGFRPYIWLSLLCFVMFFSGISSVPVMDRDEARFAQATKQMLETNDFVQIRYQDTARNKKPVGIYWLQALSVSAFSSSDTNKVWAYRVPSAIGAWLAVILTFMFGQILFDRRTAFLASFFLASSVLLSVESHLAKTDAMLLATTVLTLGSLGVVYFKERHIYEINCPWCHRYFLAFLFWFGLGCSVLIKGPLIPVIVILTIGALFAVEKRAWWLKSLYPIWGILLFIAIVAPWFYLINQATGSNFMKNAFLEDMLPKIIGGSESHGAPPGYYLLLVSLTLWPASLYLWPAIIGAKRDKDNPSTKFCMAWAYPSWIMFELVPTKLPHYVLPLYPALVLIIARSLIITWRNTDILFLHKFNKIWSVVWSFIGVILAGGFIYLSKELGQGAFYPWALIAAALALAVTYMARYEQKRYSYFSSGIWAASLASLMFLIVFCKLMPSLDKLWLSREVAHKIEVMNRAQDAEIFAVGYHEPSLVFLVGTKTKLVTLDEAVALFKNKKPVIAVIADGYDKDFTSKIKKKKLKLFLKGEVKGLNYSRGKDLTLRIYSNYNMEH